MKKSRQVCVAVVAALAIASHLLSGCAARNDTISRAEATEKSKPDVAEIKASAEEGFIYGLPIVMNYAVMYDYVIDRNSGRWKAPSNQISNEHRVFTYKDTTVVTPNSDTPYSMAWLDLRAEPIVISVPAVDKKRYYSVMLCDGNTFNYGYIGSRATGNDPGDNLVAGPRWQGQTPLARRGKGGELAAGTGWADLPGDASVLAERHAAFHSSARLGHVAAAGARASEVSLSARRVKAVGH